MWLILRVGEERFVADWCDGVTEDVYEILARVRSELTDWIAESKFGWGEQRWIRYSRRDTDAAVGGSELMPEKETELGRFNRVTSSSSIVEVLLKGHLLFEDKLTSTLQFLIPYPEHLDPLDRMGFYRKVKLCGAMGYISQQEIDTLLAFNKLRNSIAHRLDAEITAADIQAVTEHLRVTEFDGQIRMLRAVRANTLTHLKFTLAILFLHLSQITNTKMMEQVEASRRDAMREAIVEVAKKYGVDLTGGPTTSADEPNST